MDNQIVAGMAMEANTYSFILATPVFLPSEQNLEGKLQLARIVDLR